MLSLTELAATYDSINLDYNTAEFSAHDITANQEDYYAEFFIFGNKEKKKKGWLNILDIGGLGLTAATLALGAKKLNTIRNEVKREAKAEARKTMQKQFFGDKTDLEITQLTSSTYENKPVPEVIALVGKNKSGLDALPDPVREVLKSYTESNILQSAMKQAGLENLTATQQNQLFTSAGVTKGRGSLVTAALMDNDQITRQELVNVLANKLSSVAQNAGLIK